jgi:hypothetical protein
VVALFNHLKSYTMEGATYFAEVWKRQNGEIVYPKTFQEIAKKEDSLRLTKYCGHQTLYVWNIKLK